MYPSQDVTSSIGNLIALPLQGQALKNGNSAFVDENWNAYPDQWDILFNKTEKLGIEDIEQCIAKWQGELAEARGTLANIDKNARPKPWKKKCEFFKTDVVGKLHIVLSNGVYIDALNLMPRIQNQIRSLAAFDNNVKRQGFLLMFLIREIQDIQSEYLLREICERSRNWRQKNYCHIPMAF